MTHELLDVSKYCSRRKENFQSKRKTVSHGTGKMVKAMERCISCGEIYFLHVSDSIRFP
jgi:succinate dehydrogenase/fumarate reductase-like Fe-S protein